MADKNYLPPFELRKHQITALDKMHNKCVLKGGVGSGKTFVSLVYYMRHEAPKDIYVITTARKRDELDWVGSAAKFAIGRERDSTAQGILTVDSWNNITKYADLREQFFIFDEQRLVGSGAWVKAFLKIARYNNWIMLSATPGDNWMDYIPVFLANGFYKNRTEFIRRHVVYNTFAKYPKVDRYVGTATLAKHRKTVVVDMPFERHTTRHIKSIFTDYNEFLYDRIWKDRWNIYDDCPIRDISETFRLVRKLVNEDSSKIPRVVESLERNRKLIVFYNFDYELDILRSLAEAIGVTKAEWNGHKHEPVPDTKSWLYLVQYTAGAEAWECTKTNAMLFYSLTYSNKIFEQAQGRIDRMNTPYRDLYYYILRSKAPIDSMIYQSLMAKKDFNEKEFVAKH